MGNIMRNSELSRIAAVTGDKSELKPGAHVGINATKQPDGSLQTARVNVGRGDVIPD